jgi:predicted PhzF superfamily epimerase YddE/YHI9
MSQTIYQVDAFTGEPFRGNPAGVCVLLRELPEAIMQKVAAEMNLSETAFLMKRGDSYELRWFTPAVEVDLCGHATLASAHVLWEAGHESPERELRFHTRSGELLASRQLGKSVLHAYQASSRGGSMRVRLSGDRVRLAGKAVTVLRGELFL